MKKILLFSVTALSALTLAACSPASEPETTKGSASEPAQEPKKDDKWDESTKTLTVDDGVLKIDRTEKTTDMDGKPAVKVYFTLTNKRDEAQTAQMLFGELARVQQRTQDTSNDLQYAMLPLNSDGTEIEENNLQANINPDGTVSGMYPFLLENETDPVVILLQDGLFGGKVAEYEISLN